MITIILWEIIYFMNVNSYYFINAIISLTNLQFFN